MGRNPEKAKDYRGYTIAPCSKITTEERWFVDISNEEDHCPKFCNLSAAMNYVDAIKTIVGLGSRG